MAKTPNHVYAFRKNKPVRPGPKEKGHKKGQHRRLSNANLTFFRSMWGIFITKGKSLKERERDRDKLESPLAAHYNLHNSTIRSLSCLQCFCHAETRYIRDWREFFVLGGIIFRRRGRRSVACDPWSFSTKVRAADIFVMHAIFPACSFTILFHDRQGSTRSSYGSIGRRTGHCSQNSIVFWRFRRPVPPGLVRLMFGFVDDPVYWRPSELSSGWNWPTHLLTVSDFTLDLFSGHSESSDKFDEAITIAFWWNWWYLGFVMW